MSKAVIKGLVPKLRFPEFRGAGDWEEKPLEKVAKIITGNTPKTAKLDNYGGDRLFVSPADIFGQRYITTIKTTLSDQGFEKTRPIKENSILFVCIGSTIGKIAQNKFECATNQQINSVVPFDEYSNNFIYSILENNSEKIAMLAGRQAVPIINKTLFSSVIIRCPSPKEQQKIADCLSSLDDLITAHTQKHEALKAHKKGLMQQLFPATGETVPKLRFPEYDENLKIVGFAELGEIKIGLTHKPEYIESGKPFLSSKNISKGYIDFENIKYISEEKFSSMPESTKPKIGDILFTRVGSNLGNPIILEEDREFGIFRTNKKEYNYYIKHWMDSDYFWIQVKQKVAGGAKDNLNTTWLKEFKLSIPSFVEQQKIANCLSSIDDLITAHSQKIESLKAHKKGLMQQLFPSTNEAKP